MSDSGCTGSPDTSACQTLSAGNSGQEAAPGTDDPPAGGVTAAITPIASPSAALLTLE